MEVKICGVRTLEGARACAEAGATYAGLNFVPGVRRQIAEEAAPALIEALGEVVPVGVFQNQPVREVQRIARAAGLRWVQLHGEESPEDCQTLLREFQVIKAVTAGSYWNPYVGVISRWLVDGRNPGSGEAWFYVRPRGMADGTPMLLAGGLHPGNVASAISMTKATGVDVASGVERDGEQDPEKIHAFVRAARGAAETMT